MKHSKAVPDPHVTLLGISTGVTRNHRDIKRHFCSSNWAVCVFILTHLPATVFPPIPRSLRDVSGYKYGRYTRPSRYKTALLLGMQTNWADYVFIPTHLPATVTSPIPRGSRDVTGYKYGRYKQPSRYKAAFPLGIQSNWAVCFFIPALLPATVFPPIPRS
ncbi:hypothetical protein J6590_032015 [Homalodisca vitripennis]|nr:hypothetical protein J6590_032015 [Homalodisca vitripennis]